MAAKKTPAKKTPAKKTPAVKKPAPRQPAARAPAAKAPVAKTPAAKAPPAKAFALESAAPAVPKKPSRKKEAPAGDTFIEAPADLSPTGKRTNEKLVRLASQVIAQVENGKSPSFAVPTRSLSNAYFDEKKRVVQLGDDKSNRQFFNASMAKKFMQTFLVAKGCRELIFSGKTTSIRDLYYGMKHSIGETKQNTFEEQDESDPIIEDLEVTVDALREELHLFANKKGSMVGPLTVRDRGDEIDLRRMGSGGWAVPSIVEPDVVQFVKHEAKYILLIEKAAVWSRFNEDKFWRSQNCIIVEGGGQPPRGVRRLVQRMHKELKLPLYVLVDNDPWGFYIYSVMKQGSINLAYESMRMAVPDARFLGLSSFDVHKYGIPDGVSMKMKEEDTARAKQMLSYPWFKDVRWQREINEMVRTGRKFEIEALNALGISYITEEYLPRKIRDRDWLA